MGVCINGEWKFLEVEIEEYEEGALEWLYKKKWYSYTDTNKHVYFRRVYTCEKDGENKNA